MKYLARYQTWVDNHAFDEATRKELMDLADDHKEIEERFFQDLEFGTGGLRGILGAGTNRMNTYTVRRASQGMADYILANTTDGKERGVAISHDSRRYSRDFAIETALIMVQNGIKAYLFEDLRPTPQLSFTIRHLGCIAGVMVTASHNPPEYNGYKAYWSDGGQLVFPQDEDVIAYVNKIEDLAGLKVAGMDDALKSGMVTILGKDYDDDYMQVVLEQSLNSNIISNMADDFNIVYTPLNGAGNMPVRNALAKAGFRNVFIVPEQENPDPSFSTLAYPNPEDPAAFKLAIKLANVKNADIIIATDPDADRVGVMVKNVSGEYELLSGNSAGVLMAEYILSQRRQNGTLPPNPGIISTVVSTRLTSEIAKAYNAGYADVLTGFKHIANQIRTWEQSGEYEYVYGFEESYGYLAGSAARDKDAIIAAMLICEIALYYKSKNMSLFDALDDIYKKYGYFMEAAKSITLKGLEGLAEIKSIMDGLRSNPPKQAGKSKVKRFDDYLNSVSINIQTGQKTNILLPVSNVLYFELEGNAWFCIRPSGTEPKIKVYMGVKESNAELSNVKLNQLYVDVLKEIGL